MAKSYRAKNVTFSQFAKGQGNNNNYTLTTGSPTVTTTVHTTTLLGFTFVGMRVTGTGVPTGTTVTAHSGGTITMSANATASGAQYLTMTDVGISSALYTVPVGATAKITYMGMSQGSSPISNYIWLKINSSALDDAGLISGTLYNIDLTNYSLFLDAGDSIRCYWNTVIGGTNLNLWMNLIEEYEA